MEIEIIKRTVDLLKAANRSNYVTLVELARELRLPKTEVMAFLQQNPKLCILSHRWKPREKKITREMYGRKYKDTIEVRGRDLGTCIEQVYQEAHENYLTPEWLEKVKETHKKYLQITASDNYGYIQGYYVVPDTDINSEYRYHLWRNTAEKIKQISEYLFSMVFVYGGLGDSSTQNVETAIHPASLEKLKKKGWTFNDLPPLSQIG